MIPQAQVEKLRRFDRRLRVVPSQKHRGLFDVVYEDAECRTTAALRGIYEITARELNQLMRASPWRMNLSYRSWIRENIEAQEQQREEAARNPFSRELHQEAFDKLRFYERGRNTDAERRISNRRAQETART